MSSKEIVLAVLVKDPVQVWAYQTLATCETMLRSNESWVPLWRQAWEAMQKRRIRPANVDRVLRRIGWSMENALQNSPSSTRMEAPTSSKQKSSKIVGET